MSFRKIAAKLKQVAAKPVVTAVANAGAVPFYMLRAFNTAKYASDVFKNQHPRFFNRTSNSSGTSNNQAPTFNVTAPTMTTSPASGSAD